MNILYGPRWSTEGERGTPGPPTGAHRGVVGPTRDGRRTRGNVDVTLSWTAPNWTAGRRDEGGTEGRGKV
jgi:hypothetical protein